LNVIPTIIWRKLRLISYGKMDFWRKFHTTSKGISSKGSVDDEPAKMGPSDSFPM